MGNRRRSRAIRPALEPLSWIIATASPLTTSSSVSGAPQAATSGRSLLPSTTRTGAYVESSSSTSAVQTSPACRIRSAPSRWAATAGGQRFQKRGLWVSERTATRIDLTLSTGSAEQASPLVATDRHPGSRC